jgi:hypothetical protein
MVASILLMLLSSPGCLSERGVEWGHGAKFKGFDPNTLNRGGAADFTVLAAVTGIFYDRITNRRFNSKATFDDPALREFFPSNTSFADYYAALAESLERHHFESHRPSSVRLLAIERTGSNRVGIEVRLRGQNGLPLRWWGTQVIRRDRWEYASGRWWIIPGKV